MIVLPYLHHQPQLASTLNAAPDAVVIGRAVIGANCYFGQLATVRADGEDIRISDDCWFGDFSTVHIAHSVYPTIVGQGCSIGRYALVHACNLGAGVVLGENSVVMDNTQVGAGAVVAADSIVPPGKTLDRGWLYAGTPAKAVRAVTAVELNSLHAQLRAGNLNEHAAILASSTPVAGLTQVPGNGRTDLTLGDAYVAPTASLTGTVELGQQASIWFGVEIRGHGATIEIGAGSNVQDNTRIMLAAGERVAIGRRVTVGHNVRMAACEIGDEAMIGMGSQVGAGTVVGANGVIAAGEIWSGAPARRWKPLPPDNRAMFARGVDVYMEYTRNYMR